MSATANQGLRGRSPTIFPQTIELHRMIRSFLAISLPDDVSDRLIDLQTGVKNARWIADDAFHVTLVFLGNCDTRELSDLDSGLTGLRMERFDLTPQSVGAFGGSKPHHLFSKFAESEPLRRLQSKLVRMARDAEIPVEQRKFVPHVTLARCGGGVIPMQAVEWTNRNTRFVMEPFTVHSFGLFRSDLGTGAPVYTKMAQYDLIAGSD